MECKKEHNLKKCNCSYDPCSRKGSCCDCLAYHLKNRELPGCCFSNLKQINLVKKQDNLLSKLLILRSRVSREAERTYDRSFEHFARLVSQHKI